MQNHALNAPAQKQISCVRVGNHISYIEVHVHMACVISQALGRKFKFYNTN